MDILDTHAYDRRQKRNMSCHLFLSLLPFFLSAGLFFYLLSPDFRASVPFAGVKSAPVLLLAAVVLSWNRGQSFLGVVGGLVFSAVGDCCLVWQEYFLLGMVAFAVAHLLYSLTFMSGSYAERAASSSTSLWFLYLILFICGGGFYFYLYPFIKQVEDADKLVPAVAVYVFLIGLMASLAIRTRSPLTVLGSVSFMVSDITLALQIFKVIAPTMYGEYVIMSTYYLAQLLIALGDIKASENTDDFSKWKQS